MSDMKFGCLSCPYQAQGAKYENAVSPSSEAISRSNLNAFNNKELVTDFHHRQFTLLTLKVQAIESGGIQIRQQYN